MAAKDVLYWWGRKEGGGGGGGEEEKEERLGDGKEPFLFTYHCCF